jgi:hypothetical protein
LNTATITKATKAASHLLPKHCILLGQYTIEIFKTIDSVPECWDKFANKYQTQYCKELLGVAEKSQLRDFSYYYVIVRESDDVKALLYFQSLVVRKDYYPDFSKLSFAAKNFYCLLSSHNYNLLVNGHIFSTDVPGIVIKKNWSESADVAPVFEKVVSKVKKLSCSSIFIIKDASALLTSELVKNKSKYKAMPDDILMEMKLPAHWKNVEDYIEALSKKYAVRAKKIEQSIAQFKLYEFNANDIIAHEDELNKLYTNVIQRSSFKMGVLNMQYFAGLKSALKHNFIFKVWKLNDEIVGFTSYINLVDHIELYYIGIDYKINKSHHLYQCMLQQGIKDAIILQKTTLRLGRTAYEAKAIAGAKPVSKSNFFQISNPILKIGYRYSADYFIAENSTNWQVRNPFKE